MQDDIIYSREKPFYGALKQRHRLNKPGSNKETIHYVIDLQGSGMRYNVGDSIAILPENNTYVVDSLLHSLRANGSQKIYYQLGESNISFKKYLTNYANICLSLPHKKFIKELLERQCNPLKKKDLELLISEKDIFDAYCASSSLIDLLNTHSEVVWHPQEIVDVFPALLPRFYSIASAQAVVGEEVHLTVVSVKYSIGLQERIGVCTDYLKKVPLNSKEIALYLQPTKHFHLPKDPTAPIIMIGPGTGVAPFRAFMQERVVLGAPGKNWLFFGEWSRAYDFLYESEWEALVAQNKLKLSLAFSRDQLHKVYVQHKMEESAHEIWNWLNEGAYIYICGDAKYMAKDVESVLFNLVKNFGHMDDTTAHTYLRQLRKEGRLQKDVY